MGTIMSPTRCYFTGLKTENLETDEQLIEYRVANRPKEYYFKISPDLKLPSNRLYQTNKHIFKGLYLNRIWPKQYNVFITEEELQSVLDENLYPKSIQELYNNLFLTLYNSQEYAGEQMEASNTLRLWQPEHLYFKNDKELQFYLDTLIDDGLIATSNVTFQNFQIAITYKGLEYGMALQTEGFNSKNCFVAMSFGKEMGEIRNAIKRAVETCGYNSILIDEIPIESDLTINDAIIANLKRSKFCIADFTEQKDGVYFEAGYALGRGLPVIYLCHKDWFQETHFDTNHFPHIVYENIQAMEKQLVDRIFAWIS